jgi:GNAT superfamily N-acetyltransferase
MVEEGLAWARGKGAGRVWLWVDATNPGGAAFYERLGFAATGKVRAVREGSSVVERGYEVLL